ncbi:MAG TPA: PEP-CTERM sorting domain-containing protein [Terriglobales bacterium]|nr:PEP-CTERM sorting domain-containing protein [Terriglobales bacterium]
MKKVLFSCLAPLAFAGTAIAGRPAPTPIVNTPEPSAFYLTILGLALVGWFAYRRRRPALDESK